MFAQLTTSENSKDLIIALEAHHSKCYQLGIGNNISKLSLARANQDRDYQIFEEFEYQPMPLSLSIGSNLISTSSSNNRQNRQALST